LCSFCHLLIVYGLQRLTLHPIKQRKYGGGIGRRRGNASLDGGPLIPNQYVRCKSLPVYKYYEVMLMNKKKTQQEKSPKKEQLSRKELNELMKQSTPILHRKRGGAWG
jgi:hypothetical protein